MACQKFRITPLRHQKPLSKVNRQKFISNRTKTNLVWNKFQLIECEINVLFHRNTQTNEIITYETHYIKWRYDEN